MKDIKIANQQWYTFHAPQYWMHLPPQLLQVLAPSLDMQALGHAKQNFS